MTRIEAQCVWTNGKTMRDIPLAIAGVVDGNQVIAGPIGGAPAKGRALVTWYDAGARQFFARGVGAACEWVGAAVGLHFQGPILVGKLFAVAGWPDGRFAIAYSVDEESHSTDDLYDSGLFVEVRDGAGALESGPFRIGEPGGRPEGAALTVWGPRNLAVVWNQGAHLLGRALDLSAGE